MIIEVPEERLSEPAIKAAITRLLNAINNKKTKQGNFDLEAIYAVYPRKEGKTKGMIKLKKIVQSQADYEAVMGAVKVYAAKCLRDRTEKDYVKHFSTFMNCWQDYIADANSPAVFDPTKIDWSKK